MARQSATWMRDQQVPSEQPLALRDLDVAGLERRSPGSRAWSESPARGRRETRWRSPSARCRRTRGDRAAAAACVSDFGRELNLPQQQDADVPDAQGRRAPPANAMPRLSVINCRTSRAATGADRQPQRDLARAERRAAGQQSGDVGARHAQHRHRQRREHDHQPRVERAPLEPHRQLGLRDQRRASRSCPDTPVRARAPIVASSARRFAERDAGREPAA